MDYLRIWKVRKIQLMIVAALSAIWGVGTAIEEKSLVAGLLLFVTWTWLLGALVACFTKIGDRGALLSLDLVGGLFSLTQVDRTQGSMFWTLMLAFFMVRFMWGMAVLSAKLIYGFFSYPFTTVYYCVKAR